MVGQGEQVYDNLSAAVDGGIEIVDGKIVGRQSRIPMSGRLERAPYVKVSRHLWGPGQAQPAQEMIQNRHTTVEAFFGVTELGQTGRGPERDLG